MSTEFHSLKIQTVEKLTKDSVAVTFELPAELAADYQYRQGQHLTLKADLNGVDTRRSYSICNSVAAQKLTVGIKQIPEGTFSSYANNQLKPGMMLEVMPPHGHFYTELNSDNNKHYLLLAVGSGITPNLSHIQSILESEPLSRVTLIYGNRSSALMMFRDKLSFIKNEYLERFQLINLFSREEVDASLLNGRISAEKLVALFQAGILDLETVNDVFLCGPESMILEMKAFFKANKFLDEQLHYELFFAGTAEESAKQSQAERAKKFGEKTAQVSVRVAGRKTKMDLAMGGMSILDAAMENGADLPFSCKGGVCATCKAKVVSGKVDMDLNHSLTEEEVADGMVLTCQAHPVSDEVEVDFDCV